MTKSWTSVCPSWLARRLALLALVGCGGDGSADQIDDSPEILFICRQLRGPKIIERRSALWVKTIFKVVVKLFFMHSMISQDISCSSDPSTSSEKQSYWVKNL